jgi:hypothetical protein
MSEAINKKPYVTPQVFRVELNQEQAILTACSLTTMNVSNGGNSSCRPGSCKRHTGVGGGDSGARPS